VVVPKGNSISLVLKGDVSSYAASGATDNSTHVFKIASSSDSDNGASAFVIALGNTSNQSSSVVLSSGSGAPAANAQTIMRTRMTATAASLGTLTGRNKGNSTDDIGTITFTADSAGVVGLNTVTITFSGTAPTSSFLDAVSLLDNSNVNVTAAPYSAVVATSSTNCNGTNTCSKSWNFGSGTSGFQVLSGSVTFKLRIDNTKTFAGSNGVSQTLGATINANTDVTYTDGIDSGSTSGLALQSNAVPITIDSLSFASGQ
jgi:hypothetical protein